MSARHIRIAELLERPTMHKAGAIDTPICTIAGADGLLHGTVLGVGIADGATEGMNSSCIEGPGIWRKPLVMTAEWLEYYNKERPHSSLDYLSPQMYRDAASTPPPYGEFFGAIFPLRRSSRHSGRNAYATKPLQKWIDIRGYRMV